MRRLRTLEYGCNEGSATASPPTDPQRSVRCKCSLRRFAFAVGWARFCRTDPRGSSHLLKAGVAEILNLQPRGSMAKPYQVKQVRTVIVRYNLAGEIE